MTEWYHYLFEQMLIDGRYYIAHREKRLVVSALAFVSARAAQDHVNQMEHAEEYVVIEAAQIDA